MADRRGMRGILMMAVVWLGILMPTLAGVSLGVPADPLLGDALAVHCLPLDRAFAAGEGPQDRPDGAGDPHCFFCYPATNGAAGLLAPSLPTLPAPAAQALALRLAGEAALQASGFLPPRARDPPTRSV
ncbi:hypothetical protein Rru_A3451 [Rhodospirillum rubrum ATCC 11170]|uniref:DUF2946 domain-containing protein n=2 Tax=Rhodospirillum rubrum TaxID=1085 RepID=Q2RNQ0_RHORT|nr:hypothetical protein Rru_A3451 [Rhodospirillum rubrum ATCC 11170]MBK5955963.1 hypothetical protein [Rhodospirillum rubrum]